MNPDQAQFKSIGMSLKAVESDNALGEFEAILSTSDMDREGETVAPGAFQPLPASIPIHFDHDFRDKVPPIGRGVPFYDGDVLKVRGTFASTPRAQEMRALVNEGVIDSMSAGFITTKRKGKSIVAGDLFEGSLTATPINRSALLLRSKSLGSVEDVDLKAGARNNADDKKRIQAMHNLSAELGATCNTDSGAGNVTITGAKSLKSIVGTVEALQDRVRDALEDAYGEYAAILRGVDPAKGVVYFDRYASDVDGTFVQSFTDDGAVVTLDGDATEVDVHEIVVPDADADRETQSLPTAAAPADAADLKSAASAAAATVDEEAALLALKAEALALVAHAAAI